MADEGAENLPTAVTKAYDLLLWLINHVGKFPRSHRFVLGDRIESRIRFAAGPLEGASLAFVGAGGERSVGYRVEASAMWR